MTDGVEVIKLSSTAITTIKELNSNHEETDTRMVSHANHASSDSNPIVIASPDTDVFVICLAFQHIINSDIFFLTGVKNSRRTIDISAVAENIFVTFNLCEASKEMIMESLIGLHSFTGCDTTSAFAGRRKVKPLTLMLKDQDYVETFSLLGKEIHLQEELVVQIKRFVCHMYGWKGIHSPQEIWYKIYCQSGGKIACEKLPPCDDVLELHIMRANYQAFIWRQSLLAQQSKEDPLQNS